MTTNHDGAAMEAASGRAGARHHRLSAAATAPDPALETAEVERKRYKEKREGGGRRIGRE